MLHLTVLTGVAKPVKTNSPSEFIGYLTPEEEAKTFICEDGYHLELVVGDPVIKEPVLTVFDGDGRMYVAEMRSFMQNIDGTDEGKRNGRVSVHWSSQHNGIYDKHAVFADHLLLPRMVLPVAGGIIINETDSDDFYLYTDSKGDGVADKKALFYGGGPRGGNLEHQPGGMISSLDNWIYFAVNAYRLRISGTKVLTENILPNGDQWGLCQDDYGKPWGMNAGTEAGPVHFQVPFRYGTFSYSNQSAPEYSVVWPVIGLPDMESGSNRFRPVEKSLNHFTATCGSDIYRGDRLPPDLRGDLLFAEPVGRLIRRTKVEVTDGLTVLRNAYEDKKSEFIRSTDPNFRPVNVAEAPDGSVYITDMYRGVIQEKDWVQSNSYLRGVIKQYNLDKNIGRGRIWRLAQDGFTPNPQPRLLRETPAELATHLESLSGWWRDTAQQLLVLKGDKSVAPKLIEMARSNSNHLARIHAIWTLEGLDSLTADLVRDKLTDAEPQVRVATIHASETLYNQGDHSLVPDICGMGVDPDPRVVIQALLTANVLQWRDYQTFIRSTIDASASHGVREIGRQIVANFPPWYQSPRYPVWLNSLIHTNNTEAENKMLVKGEIIYRQLCFICHALDGRGTPYQSATPGATLAPALWNSEVIAGPPDALISLVLKGLTGPVDGKTYDAQMIPMESNDDAWMAAVLSYIRNNFGHHSTLINEAEVTRVHADLKSRKAPWTLDELRDRTPQYLTNRNEWKLTASQNSAGLRAAIDGQLETRYDTLTSQTPGIWVQIELPRETEIAGVELDLGDGLEDYPRGYAVTLSDSGTTWGKPVAAGRSSVAHNQIMFPTERAKFIRITLTASEEKHFWSIAELQVLSPLSAEDRLRMPHRLTQPLGTGAGAVAR